MVFELENYCRIIATVWQSMGKEEKENYSFTSLKGEKFSLSFVHWSYDNGKCMRYLCYMLSQPGKTPSNFSSSPVHATIPIRSPIKYGIISRPCLK